MKLIRLILFLLISNSIFGQTSWSFKERPLVPIYGPAVNFNDTTSATPPTTDSFTSLPSGSYSRAMAVASKCIDNLDFEMGDFTNWKCYTGTAKTKNSTNYVQWSPTTPVAPISNRHQIISASSLPVNDPYGNFPRLCPNGGNYSLQLGNNSTGSQAEKVSCSFTIPADQNNFQIEYYYAVVFQDPNHPFDEQPRFQTKVYDANNNSNIISCASYDFTAASGLPGFKVSTLDNSVLYKPWSAVTINLSGYAGHTVILEFTTEDCTLGGHFGYAYVDVNSNCVSLTKTITYCKNTPSITLDAPPGYEFYNWYDSSFTQLLGTGQTVTFSPPPTTDGIVNVDLIPYNGFGCRDTAYSILKVNPVPAASFASNTVACVGKPISFINTSTISDNSALTYQWDFGDNTTSSSTDFTKTYNSVGNYNVKLIATSINGCVDSLIRNVSVGALAAINPILGSSNICLGQTELMQNSTAGGTWRSTRPTIATINNAGLVTAISAGMDTIRYIVSNSYGCQDSVSLSIKVIPISFSTTNASICQGDSYLFNGTVYNSAGTYVKHLINVAGCDSTATLNLGIKLPTSSTTNAAICQGSSYTFNGTNYSIAGTYVSHLLNAVGCDSTATLNLSIKLPTSSTTSVAICQGSSYTFNGTNYSSAGTYTYHTLNAVGCDSTATLNLSIKLPTSSTTNAAICQGDSYTFNGTNYSSAGTYVSHLINAVGCDSTATLNLSIKLPTSSTTNAAICQGSSYTFNGTNYSTAGTYTYHTLNAVGCDSTATLNLSIKLPTSSTTNVAICQGDSYTFNGTNYSSAGTYTYHTLNAVGCDSTATLNLSIKLPTSSTTNVAICQGDIYTFNGTNYSSAGTYAYHTLNAVGCDSTATLNLSLKLPTSSTTNVAICQGDSYTFNGTNYSSAGTYTYHTLNAVGCDSIATLNLSIKLSTSSTTNAVICQGDSYTFNGTNYSSDGTYVSHLLNAVGCDSTATLNLSIKLPTSSTINVSICQGSSYAFNGTNYSVAGTYTYHTLNAVGCDSTATLNLSIKLPTSSTTNAAICQGDSYLFNGTNYSVAGTYVSHLLNAVGCDSTATLSLKVKLPSFSISKKTICTTDLPYLWNGLAINEAGSQTVRLINSVGCDSVATLELIVDLPTTSFSRKTICAQDLPFAWNGLVCTGSGVQKVTLTNSVGCDSIATLELIVNPTTTSITEVTTCPSALPFMWNGVAYNAAGKYSIKLTGACGCDSIATLVLNVKSPLTSITKEYVCYSLLPYSWNGKLYTVSGTYTAEFTTAAGCDSIATLALTVVSPSVSISREAVRSSELPFVWNKMEFTESGTYVSPEKYVNSAGCDSIAKLILKVNLSTSAVTNASVCASDLPYVWNATSYNTAGTYTKIMTNALGQDVTVTLNLKVISAQTISQSIQIFPGESYSINGHAYDKEGVYIDDLKTVNGCDSTVITNLSFINIPNTITPNGDGHNDYFMKGWHTKVYNRNGILLYDGTEGWNGNYNNKPVSKDTYFYVLYYTSGTQTKAQEGYLMVVP